MCKNCVFWIRKNSELIERNAELMARNNQLELEMKTMLEYLEHVVNERNKEDNDGKS
jgi:hypothetical protein